VRSATHHPEHIRAVTRDRPCEVCGGTHKCSRGEDGLIVCGRHTGEQPGFKFLAQSDKDSQWSTYRREDDPRLKDDRPPPRFTPPTNGRYRVEPDPTWEKRMRAQEGDLTPEWRAELAQTLGLPEAAITALRIGFAECGPHRDPDTNELLGECWTSAEVDADGRVIGINCRYRDGQKKAWTGGGRGLAVPAGWREREGPIFIPEGASDALAFTAVGLSAVGRPSNTGGVEHLAALLKDVPPDRPIVVTGEYDPKPNGKWPGRDGAVKTAEQLQAKLGRPVTWVLPPSGAKDLRKWVQDQTPDVTCADEWQNLGQRLLDLWEKKYQTVADPQAESMFGRFRFEPLPSAEFASKIYTREWLVRRLFVLGQPVAFGGPKKAMKTSLLVDLTVSLGTGTPFLGEFAVPRRVRVALLSAESGDATLQETARRVCAARGLDLADVDALWGFSLPKFGDQLDLAALQDGLRDHAVEVAIFDPVYLAALSGQGAGGPRAENLFEMGPLFLNVTRICLAVGTTPILVCHGTKATSRARDPLELEDLAYSGIAEFARQWALLSRRETYEPGTGFHQLWMNVGGSSGHGGLWSVDVDEGVIDEHFRGRRWDVTVQTASAVRQATKTKAEEEREQKHREQDAADDEALIRALDQLDPDAKGAGLNRVKVETRLSETRLLRAVGRLTRAEIIEERPVTVEIGSGTQRPAKGIRRRAEE